MIIILISGIYKIYSKNKFKSIYQIKYILFKWILLSREHKTELKHKEKKTESMVPISLEQ